MVTVVDNGLKWMVQLLPWLFCGMVLGDAPLFSLNRVMVTATGGTAKTVHAVAREDN
jgi:hypothetical protein